MTIALPAALSGRRRELDTVSGRVSFYEDGPAEPAAEAAHRPPPLLLVHSVNAAASAYEVKPLYDHYRATRPVYALDLPGYGFSDRSARFYSIRLMTDAVIALVHEIVSRHGSAPFDAIAVSLSSEYLARAAVEHPTVFRSVTLVSATGLNRVKPFYGPPGSSRGKSWLLSALGKAPWSEGLFRLLTRPKVIRFFLEKTWGSKDIDVGMLDYDVITTRQPGASNAPFHFLSAFLFSADITRVYEQVPVPVLLIHGIRGDFVDYRGAAHLVKTAAWSLHVMPTGAMPYFEDLAGFIAAWERFIRERVARDR